MWLNSFKKRSPSLPLLVATVSASSNYLSIDLFSPDAAELCDLTDLSVYEYGARNAPDCDRYACTKITVIEFRATEESGEEFVWRAEISGDVDGHPVATATKSVVQGWVINPSPIWGKQP